MMRPLKIGIDASGLIGGKLPTGLQRYLACLITHLASRCEADNLILYLYFVAPVPPHAYAPGKPLAGLQPEPHIRWRIAPMKRGWQRVGMGIAMLIDRLDLFHFPAPIMAGFCPRPAIVTFHDVAALSLQGDITEKERRYLPAAMEAAHRASAVIAVSESAGQEVRQHLQRPDTVVIPEGVDLSQFQPASDAAVQAIRKQYDLDRFVLCVGTLQTRKNHLRLIQAFEKIQAQIPHSLAIAGGNGSGAEAIQAHLAAHPNPRIRLLGYVEDDNLPALYTAADGLALPSLWEGFGLPLLEAMACGTPVLTSDTSSLREVTGDAGLLVNPNDVDDIAENLKRLLTDDPLRARLREAGFQRARLFSWEGNARRTIEVYRHVAAISSIN